MDSGVPILLIASLMVPLVLLLPVISLRFGYLAVTGERLGWLQAIVTTLVGSLVNAVVGGVVGAGLSAIAPELQILTVLVDLAAFSLVVSALCSLDLVQSVMVAIATWMITAMVAVACGFAVFALTMALSGAP